MATTSEPRDSDSDATLRLIMQAKAGSSEALGQLLERFRPYLLQVAFEELDSELRVKESPSDLVQKSFMEATGAFQGFQGDAPESLQAWLRNILLNNLRDLRDHYRTDKRQISREVERVENVIADCLVDPTPPTDAAIRREQALALTGALAKLDEEDRSLIRWRHQEGRSFVEIGDRLNITEEAARKRWVRAVERLRQLTKEDSSDQPG